MTQEEINIIKLNTLKEENVIFVDNMFRFINHELELLTTGWRTKESLLLNKDIIRFDNPTISVMENRYKIAKVFKMI